MGLLDKKFNILTALYIFLDKTSGHGNSTAAAATVAGATTLTVASATNFAIGDDIRVGTGETMELVRISNLVTTTITTAKPLKYAHASGEPVVEQEAYNLGVPEADGVRIRFNGETTSIFSAVSRLAFGVLTGYVDLGASWRWPFLTTDAIAMALGLPRTNVIGDGTAAHQTGTVGPRLFTTDGANFGTLQNANLVMVGTLNDNSVVKFELYNITFDPTALNVPVARGQLTTVPARVLASGGAFDDTGTAWTPQTVVQTFAGGKADIPSSISAVQTLADSGTATTTTAGIAAGAYVIPLTSATGIVAGDIVRLGSGDNAEYHIIHAIATLNANLRTQVLRAHASGVAVVKQTPTQLGVAQGGVTLAMSGQVDTERSEYSGISLGYKSRNVEATFSMNLDAITAETLLNALGIPASAYANNVLTLTGDTIARAAAKSFLLLGVTQGGKQFRLLGWNASLTVNGEIQFTQAATAQAPVSFKPNGFNWLINA